MEEVELFVVFQKKMKDNEKGLGFRPHSLILY